MTMRKPRLLHGVCVQVRRGFCWVELRGFEPLTFSLRRRADAGRSRRLSVDHVAAGDRCDLRGDRGGHRGGHAVRPREVV